MSYELISKTKPKAKKPHDCIWCREKIVAGEVHVHEFSKYCGDIQNHRWHLECENAAHDYFREYGEPEFEPRSYKRGTIDQA